MQTRFTSIALSGLFRGSCGHSRRVTKITSKKFLLSFGLLFLVSLLINNKLAAFYGPEYNRLEVLHSAALGTPVLAGDRVAVTSQAFNFSTCPTITNTSLTSVTICSGQQVSLLQVNTTALPPEKIEFVRFDEIQSNPYTNMVGIYVGEVLPVGGTATVTNADFPENMGTTDRVYYVYACLKPVPVDPTCIPFAFITVTIKPSSAATLIAKEATCFGTESKNDGYVSIGGYAPADTYELSTNGSFTGAKQAIPANGLVVSSISRAGISQTYSIRIYNSAGCYSDKAVTLTNALCTCPPSVCVPIAIQKTRSGRK